MTRALTILFLLIAGPAWAQPASDSPTFDAGLAASVLGAALAFIAPRTLDPVTVQQLAAWGLAAPASLDSSFATDICCGTVTLMKDGKALLTRPIPPDADAAAWGTLVADMLQAAAAASPDFAAGGTQGAISAFFDEMFNHLDPYSRYIPPGAATKDRARRFGEAGAGLQLARRGGVIVVTGLNANGPGAEAGILVGDTVLAVDGQPTAGRDLETVNGWVAGEDGTELSLLVRTRRLPARQLDIERAVIPPETVFASRAGDLLVLRISAFSADTDQRMGRELDRAFSGPPFSGPPASPIRAIIIDLRGNRGGRVANAVGATDLVLDRGVVATTAGRNPDAAHVWRAGNGDLTGGKPLLILVDGRTASAAEIMAAALADHGRGVVIGSATLGKGLVQKTDTLPGGGEPLRLMEPGAGAPRLASPGTRRAAPSVHQPRTGRPDGPAAITRPRYSTHGSRPRPPQRGPAAAPQRPGPRPTHPLPGRRSPRRRYARRTLPRDPSEGLCHRAPHPNRH